MKIVRCTLVFVFGLILISVSLMTTSQLLKFYDQTHRATYPDLALSAAE